MRHLIVVCLAFMMGLNVACSRVEDLGKDDLHSEPTIEIVSGDTLDIVGFTLAHELATSEGRLPYNVGDEFGYTGSDLADVQFHIRSCAQGGSVSVGERTDRYDTALLHIIRSANGEDMDVWIPCKPSELRYRCVVYHLEE